MMFYLSELTSHLKRPESLFLTLADARGEPPRIFEKRLQWLQKQEGGHSYSRCRDSARKSARVHRYLVLPFILIFQPFFPSPQACMMHDASAEM
ncbi:hypothetical protein An07g01890 [Aspergillus niger]|uniref:Uncharacterized protein n=2 Tax=Aspergillus niger TaxID=5061 RepID=A2QMF3_ASPNC|nr:hypothetical protein An07g01890 [Aspergillus niger]CAK48091.1 hypothetical protein An07g01890 [Aspergillus niger]